MFEIVNAERTFVDAGHASRRYIARYKRLFDLVAAIGGLLLAAPLGTLAALLVKLDSPGPAFYSQERLGRDAVPFAILKLRTMRTGAEDASGPVWATDDDPRTTRVGRWLRRFRIDELPQLLNVLRGEMSLVGPRPEREFFVTQLAASVPFYMERFAVRPGITGWAQVTQPYAASVVASRRKLHADRCYVKHLSLRMDLRILARTVRVVCLGRERRMDGAGGRATSRMRRMAS